MLIFSHNLHCGLGVMRTTQTLVTILALILVHSPAHSAPPALPGEVITISGANLGGRNPVPVDPVAVSLGSPDWQPPKAGDKLTIPGGPVRTWAALPVKDGAFGIPPGGYAYMPVKSEAARIVILHATGHSMVYVNGEPRVGDVYGNGYVRIPVLLREGVNDFLFAAGRGPVKAQLHEPKAAAEL
ncbi:MAG: hypothetical protein C0467_18005, partial [Planctomycetaceae bacterium]|nr:hypothetical protein [Planctomycetaceae bacterium]